MLTQKVFKYPNALVHRDGGVQLYVLMEMLVELKIIKAYHMPIYASRLRNLHWDLKQKKTTESK